MGKGARGRIVKEKIFEARLFCCVKLLAGPRESRAKDPCLFRNYTLYLYQIEFEGAGIIIFLRKLNLCKNILRLFYVVL